MNRAMPNSTPKNVYANYKKIWFEKPFMTHDKYPTTTSKKQLINLNSWLQQNQTYVKKNTKINVINFIYFLSILFCLILQLFYILLGSNKRS